MSETTERESFNDFDEEGRRIFLVGPVNGDMANTVLQALSAIPRTGDKVEVFLKSMGGSPDDAFAIYDLFRTYPGQVVIEGYGPIYSAATLVLQSGDYRYLSPNSRFLVHDGTVELGQQALVAASSQMREVEDLHQLYLRILAERTKLSLRRLRRLSEKETYLSAHEAVKLGFADEVIPYKSPKESQP